MKEPIYEKQDKIYNIDVLDTIIKDLVVTLNEVNKVVKRTSMILKDIINDR